VACELDPGVALGDGGRGIVVSRTTVTIVGTLLLSDEDGLQYSITVTAKGREEKTIWLEAVPNAEDEWPSIGKSPERPKRVLNKAEEEEWQRAHDAYNHALHANPKYRQVALDFIELQNHEPQPMMGGWLWVYRHKVCRFATTEPESLRDTAIDALLIKHHVLRRERYYERVRREVEALENMEKLEGVSREPIPEPVRLFVWQRDRGQCVKCGSRERLEFDHIIPVATGGSSTDRNVQLLCESCNRSKGSTI